MGADFARAKRLACELLLDQRPPRLPVEPTALRLGVPVAFLSMGEYCRQNAVTLEELSCGSDCLQDGCTLLRERGGAVLALVLYNDAVRHPGRRRFTLAHEIGHILLGHREDGDLQEVEANFFAVQLLLPDALLHACLRAAQGEAALADRFGVSLQMARNRVESAARYPYRPSGEDRALLARYGHLLPGDGEPVLDY